jgi:hypothetical protein
MSTHLASGAGATAITPTKTTPMGTRSGPHQGCIEPRRTESAGTESLAVESFRTESVGTGSVGACGIWADAAAYRDETETAMWRATARAANRMRLKGRGSRNVLLTIVSIAISAYSVPLSAQQPAAPRDSARVDSVPSPAVPDDSVRADTLPWCHIHCMQAALYGIVLFPSFFGLDEITFEPQDSVHVGFWGNHVAIEGDAGYGTVDGGEISQEEGWSRTVAIEAFFRGAYAELSLSHLDVPDRLVARAVRLGWFRHARPGTAGGVTVGYRRGRGDRGRDHDGLELGFPWIIRTCPRTGRCWLRFEPRYRVPFRNFGSKTVSYNYHLEATFLAGTSPFFVGGSADLRAPFKSGGVRSFTMAVVAGLRVGQPGAPGVVRR